MPNECLVVLKVTGRTEVVEKFVSNLVWHERKHEGKVTSVLASYYPMPKVLEGTVSSTPEAEAKSEANAIALAEIGYQNWYDWAIEHWGVKWPDHIYRVERTTDGGAQLTGWTAWGPPLEGYTTVMQKFPALVARLAYYEPNCAFTGWAIWKGGRCTGRAEWETAGLATGDDCSETDDPTDGALDTHEPTIEEDAKDTIGWAMDVLFGEEQ